jgi:hypothetical protein
MHRPNVRASDCAVMPIFLASSASTAVLEVEQDRAETAFPRRRDFTVRACSITSEIQIPYSG